MHSFAHSQFVCASARSSRFAVRTGRELDLTLSCREQRRISGLERRQAQRVARKLSAGGAFSFCHGEYLLGENFSAVFAWPSSWPPFLQRL